MAMSEDDLSHLRELLGLPSPALPTLISEEALVSAVLRYCGHYGLTPELSRVHLAWVWASFCRQQPTVPSAFYRQVVDSILAPVHETAPALASFVKELLRSPAPESNP